MCPAGARGALAPYACRPEASRGRQHREAEHAERTPFQRDRDRIVHSGAFRRLKHKTQVFVYHEGDYYRTRLTHSLEVAQVARSVSRALGLDEDLAEALALAHDLGHPPFGHAGERALDEAMRPWGGFDHNDQTIRVLTALERRYADFDGLNLTWETVEGVVKHNGPLLPGRDGRALPPTIAALDRAWPLDLASQPSAEAQVAAIADDIAYDAHDIDDGLRAGLFTVDDLAGLPLAGPAIAAVRAGWPSLEPSRFIHETVRRIIDAMVADLLATSRARLAEAVPASADAVRALAAPVVAFSVGMQAADGALKGFLFERMYRHYKVNRTTSKARRLVGELFRLYMAEPECLPDEWRQAARGDGEAERARVVADYIAGMTDRYAVREHAKLFEMDTRLE